MEKFQEPKGRAADTHVTEFGTSRIDIKVATGAALK